MNFLTGFLIGFFFYFIICRVADHICKDAGSAACYNCDNCTSHCAGYHCHLMREQDKVNQDVYEM